MLSIVALLMVVQKTPAASPPVLSDTTRACILEYAPQVEQEFEHLDSGMYFIAMSLCAVEIRGDLNAWQSQHLQLPWGEYSYRLDDDSHPTTQAGDPAETVDLTEEDQGIPVSIQPMGQALAEYLSSQPPNVSVVSPYEMSAATYEFIGRTLLELRINRNETERQEDN